MKHKWTLDELIDSWTLLPNELDLVSSSKANQAQNQNTAENVPHWRVNLAISTSYLNLL